MKRRVLLKLTTIALFIAALIFTVSADRKGNVSVINKAYAIDRSYKGLWAVCPDGVHVIWVCAAGSSTCIPMYYCP
ncbi:MAG TPA: hypothetical protein VK543_19320 [Puia sp.]|nr:hypothetical protein [Puia sp.]